MDGWLQLFCYIFIYITYENIHSDDLHECSYFNPSTMLLSTGRGGGGLHIRSEVYCIVLYSGL